MEISEIKVGKSYMWSGKIRPTDRELFKPPSIVEIKSIDNNYHNPIGIQEHVTHARWYVHPSTLSPLPEGSKDAI